MIWGVTATTREGLPRPEAGGESGEKISAMAAQPGRDAHPHSFSVGGRIPPSESGRTA